MIQNWAGNYNAKCVKTAAKLGNWKKKIEGQIWDIYKSPIYTAFLRKGAIWVEPVLRFRSRLTKYNFCYKLKKANNLMCSFVK